MMDCSNFEIGHSHCIKLWTVFVKVIKSTAHHIGAHRSDTLALLHSFGRQSIPPRAYTLHRSAANSKGKDEGA